MKQTTIDDFKAAAELLASQKRRNQVMQLLALRLGYVNKNGRGSVPMMAKAHKTNQYFFYYADMTKPNFWQVVDALKPNEKP